MYTKNRVFGRNLCRIMAEKGYQDKDLAESLGYSTEELYKIIDARLYVTQEEKRAIADALETPKDEFYVDDDETWLGQNAFMECRGRFSSKENREKILDLFDAYCDIKEILHESEEGRSDDI